jgi:hypothetical protein
MCHPAVFIAAAVVGGGMQAYGVYQEQSLAKEVAKNNARTAEYQAQDAVRRGEEEAMKVRRQAMGLKSAQRASLAGRGLDVSYGTAFDLQEQTDFFGDLDAETVRLNAAKDAWTLRRQRDNYLMQRDAIHPLMAASGSLLSSIGGAGMSAYGAGMIGGGGAGYSGGASSQFNVPNKGYLI